MDKDTIARLRAALNAKRTEQDLAIYGRLAPAELIEALPALLSIAERAADVEGVYGAVNMTPGVAWLKTDEQKAVATAVSRYVLGGE